MMKKNLLFFLTSLAALCFVGGGVQAQNAEPTPTISVVGSAQIKVEPDEIFLSILLDESDSKGRVTLEEQRKELFVALQACGIEIEKQLSVVGMQSTYDRRRESLAASQYELKVGSAAKAREVMAELNAHGIAHVAITRAACSQPARYQQEARKAAILNARMRAEELAEAIGQSVGACYEIVDRNTEVVPAFYARKATRRNLGESADMISFEEAEPEVSFEALEINYHLSAKFYLNTTIRPKR